MDKKIADLYDEYSKGALDRREFQNGLDLYYEMMGWDRETGVPTRGKLVELGLGWVNHVLGQE